MKKILRDPLVHFLVLGLGLFVLFDLVASDEAAYDSKVICAPSAPMEQI